jgi:SAM-dependent methyltransferase
MVAGGYATLPRVSVLRRVLNRPLPPRVSIVQRELDRFRRPRYLEIGVNVGVLFLHVRAMRKIGVDPAQRIPAWKRLGHPNTALRGTLLSMTSDEYFAALEPDAAFDVVFVDGLHTYEQSLRDVEHALRHLSSDGVVLVHDCNPLDAVAGGPDPGATGEEGWNGEVWRTIVHLRATRADLDVSVLDADFGVGLVRRGQNRAALSGVDAAELTYEDLEARRRELLGLVPYVPAQP